MKKILRKVKDDNNKVWTITRVPNYFAGGIPFISGPQLVFSKSNKLLNMYGISYDKNKLMLFLCCDNRNIGINGWIKSSV